MDNTLDDSAPVAEPTGGISTSLVAFSHLGITLFMLGLFTATNNWAVNSGQPLAALVSVATGLLAGAITTTLVHEWFHYAGALTARGSYHRTKRLNLFAFDWDFQRNGRGQFLVMSYAGTLGSAVAIALLWLAFSADSPGGVALLAAAFGSLGFAGAIEWPVLARVHAGGDPLAELSKISGQVLLLSAATGLLTPLVAAWLLS
ncbi:MAG: hypothetical protein RJQ10_06395 [Haliea sp.]|uniref:hypothetical protein n=1 Tax=Haliea sp. TaxID=1932666 RepID=UPI0032EBF4FD